ncbi:hypothetical protein [Streptomyces sp. NPDC058330]|uniref:hypothetical protein n=1 Tax=Streptomyces sp. NPDC058330 TaxID=3346449 RepID=UPI0036E5D740
MVGCETRSAGAGRAGPPPPGCADGPATAAGAGAAVRTGCRHVGALAAPGRRACAESVGWARPAVSADDAWPPRRRGRTPVAAAPVHAVRESGAVGVIHVVLLVVCAVAIHLSCEWFVNAVEWLGRRLGVGTMTVGTILAAFGTALPASVVTLVVVTTGATEEARNIGVGTAMGGPLPPSTVAYGVTGAMLLLKRREQRRAVPDAAGAGRRPPCRGAVRREGHEAAGQGPAVVPARLRRQGRPRPRRLRLQARPGPAVLRRL